MIVAFPTYLSKRSSFLALIANGNWVGVEGVVQKTLFVFGLLMFFVLYTAPREDNAPLFSLSKPVSFSTFL